jgi:hypothetical protein
MDWQPAQPNVDPLDNCEAIFPRSSGWSFILILTAIVAVIAIVIMVLSPDVPLKGVAAAVAIAIAVVVLLVMIIISLMLGGKTCVSPEGIIILDWRKRHMLVPYTEIVEMIEAIRPLRSAQEYSLTVSYPDRGKVVQTRVARFVNASISPPPQRFTELRDSVAHRAGLHTTDEEKSGLDLLTSSSFGFSAYQRHWVRPTGDGDTPDDAIG